jgi:hypothetical protein
MVYDSSSTENHLKNLEKFVRLRGEERQANWAYLGEKPMVISSDDDQLKDFEEKLEQVPEVEVAGKGELHRVFVDCILAAQGKARSRVGKQVAKIAHKFILLGKNRAISTIVPPVGTPVFEHARNQVRERLFALIKGLKEAGSNWGEE